MQCYCIFFKFIFKLVSTYNSLQSLDLYSVLGYITETQSDSVNYSLYKNHFHVLVSIFTQLLLETLQRVYCNRLSSSSFHGIIALALKIYSSESQFGFIQRVPCMQLGSAFRDFKELVNRHCFLSCNNVACFHQVSPFSFLSKIWLFISHQSLFNVSLPIPLIILIALLCIGYNVSMSCLNLKSNNTGLQTATQLQSATHNRKNYRVFDQDKGVEMSKPFISIGRVGICGKEKSRGRGRKPRRLVMTDGKAT